MQAHPSRYSVWKARSMRFVREGKRWNGNGSEGRTDKRTQVDTRLGRLEN